MTRAETIASGLLDSETRVGATLALLDHLRGGDWPTAQLAFLLAHGPEYETTIGRAVTLNPDEVARQLHLFLAALLDYEERWKRHGVTDVQARWKEVFRFNSIGQLACSFVVVSSMSLATVRTTGGPGGLEVPPAAIQADDWNEQKNERRCELIDKEIDGEISDDELVELGLLQAAMLAYRQRVAPLPLQDLRQLHQQLIDQSSAGS